MTLSFAAALLGELRAHNPLVQCITNSVVTNFTANVVLAIGAAPAMTDIVGEAGPFARVAGGVLVNLGTPTPEQRLAMEEAVAAANESATPWVLDPVAIGALPIRTALAQKLAPQTPFAIRGNASEILAWQGKEPAARAWTPQIPQKPPRRARLLWRSVSTPWSRYPGRRISSPMARALSAWLTAMSF